MATTDLANIFIKFKDRNGNLVYNMNDSVSISCADTSSAYYSVHYVKDKETYQSISYLYYGTTRLWWIITKFNNIGNVIDMPYIGTALKIPSIELKNSILAAVNSTKNL